jgi:tetratricopeptide (TPR) repeat protein
MKAILAVAAASLLALPLRLAAAEPAPDEARAAYQRGVQAYRDGRYRDAIAEFQAANRLRPSAPLHYDIGQARERLGEAAEALASYAEYLRLDPQAPNRKAVERSMAALQARLATRGRQVLLVLTDPGDAEVSLDGEPRGRSPFAAALAPGPHRVSVSLPGHRPVSRDVSLSRDRALELNLTLPPLDAAGAAAALQGTPPAAPLEATRPVPAPEPAEGRSWLGPIIAGSVAVVVAGAAVAFGAAARSAQNELLGQAHDQSQADALASRAQANAVTANVLYGVAGAAVLAGGLLVFAF